MTLNSHAQPNGKLQVFVNASKCSVLLEEAASKSLTHLSHKTNLQKFYHPQGANCPNNSVIQLS